MSLKRVAPHCRFFRFQLTFHLFYLCLSLEGQPQFLAFCSEHSTHLIASKYRPGHQCFGIVLLLTSKNFLLMFHQLVVLGVARPILGIIDYISANATPPSPSTGYRVVSSRIEKNWSRPSTWGFPVWPARFGCSRVIDKKRLAFRLMLFFAYYSKAS